MAGRADDVYSGCILSYDVQIVPYVNRVVLATQLRMFVVLMCEMEQPYK